MPTSRADINAPGTPRQPPVADGGLEDFPADPVSCMRRLHQAHGNLAALEGNGRRIVFVFGPEYNQRVLGDARTFHSQFFTLRGPRRSAQRRLTSGLLSMNGDQHKRHRRMVMGPFQKKAISAYHDAVCRLAGDMLDDWRPGQTRDMHAEMTRFMRRVTSAILFGLDEPTHAYEAGEMLDRWVEMNHRAGLGAFLTGPAFAADYEELLDLAERLEACIQSMIDARRAGENLGNDVLSILIRAHGEQGDIGDDELIGHVALLFGAAHLTTANSFTWTLFLLAQHPAVMRALDDEMRAAFPGSTPEPEHVGRMPLLERVIKESMRVLPASAYSQRVTVKPAELGSCRLPPDTPVIFSQFITHHMPELYPQPEAFRPERWETISPSAYAYLPFGAGQRMCIGGPLAMMILKTVLPMILKRYRLGVVPGASIDGKVVSTMLGPVTSVPMRIHPPDGRFESHPVTGNIHTLVDLPQPTAFARAA